MIEAVVLRPGPGHAVDDVAEPDPGREVEQRPQHRHHLARGDQLTVHRGVGRGADLWRDIYTRTSNEDSSISASSP